MSITRHEARILVLMGVSGCGKSTIAKLLQDRLGWAFQEGDELHPPGNVAKMSAGIPLEDADRAPWLKACAQWIATRHAAGEPGLLTCSALKRSYREQLSQGFDDVWFVYLQVPQETLQDRLERRSHQYMPSSLLPTQLRTLEPPGDDEQVIRVVADGDVKQTVDDVIAAL